MTTQDDCEKKQRVSETITISVLRGKYLKSTKSDLLVSTVRVEFGSNVVGESPKVQGNADYTVDYNYNASWSCSLLDPLVFDDLVYKPVVVSITEVLSREKKQKEERNVLLGQTCIDLLPLLKGQERFTVRQPLYSPHPHTEGHTELPFNQPQIEIEVSVAEPILSETEITGSNMISFRAESAYAVPEIWHQSNQVFQYVAATSIPISQEKEMVATITNGILKGPMERDGPGAQRRWASAVNLTGQTGCIPNSYLPVIPFKEEDGDLTKREDHQFRVDCETEKSRVTWNAERRCWMDSDAVTTFKAKVAHNRVWPVEIMKIVPQAQTKSRKGAHDDEVPIYFHGVAYVDFAPLLYPGARRIRGAYLLQPYVESEMQEKIQHRSVAEEASQIASGLSRNVTSAIGKKPKKTTQTTATKQSDTLLADTEGGSIDAQAYIENKTFIMLEILLDKPLVPRRPPTSLAKKVAEYIPPRPIFPTRSKSAKRTLDTYHKQIAHVAKLILEEYRHLFKNAIDGDRMAQDAKSVDDRRNELLYELNFSGTYFAFKEQLKHAIVKIVREKFLITKPFEDKDKLNTFLSELYSYLVDEMHVSLSNTLSMKDEVPPPVTVIDSTMMKHFAKEAEANGNFELAARYYQERLARNKSDPWHWFDYGTFCLLIGDINKAEECFREALTINQQFVAGLVLYGIVCHMDERNEEAETFLEAATTVEPENIIAWTVLATFYNSIEKEIFAEMAIKEANRLNLAQAENATASNADILDDEQPLIGDSKHDKEQGQDITEPLDTEIEITRIESAQTKEIPAAHVGNTQQVQGNQAQVSQSLQIQPQKNVSKKGALQKKASQQARKGNTMQSQVARNSSQTQINAANKGSRSQSALSGGMSNPDTEFSSYHATFSQVHQTEIPPPPPRAPTPVPDKSVFMRTSEFLLDVNAFQICEKVLGYELIQHRQSSDLPTQYYLYLAQLKLQTKQFDIAENNIEEALVHDYTNADCWAILGHVKYLQSKYPEARSAYERTLALMDTASNMHIVYLRLASIYLGDKEFKDAKDTFLRACKYSPSCLSWLGVGIACYRMGDLTEAEEALSEANVLNNHDPEVWGYLSLVCLRTERPEEAEQAYKYSLKVGLRNEDLLHEISEQQKILGFGNPFVSTILSH